MSNFGNDIVPDVNLTSMIDERRIWIGNLDPRLTEYHLLKLTQKCGKLDKFDLLFHKGGPLVGQSRGYAFVTFSTPEGALNALEQLNGMVISNRPIAVRLAKNLNYDDIEKPKTRIEIPALGTAVRDPKFSKEEAIRAIEKKLKMLESENDTDLEFDGNSTISNQVPFIQRYQFNKDRDTTSSRRAGQTSRTSTRPSRPYNRNQRPKRR